MKYLKKYNESVKNFLKPKDITELIYNLSDEDKLIKGCQYNIDWLVKDMINKGVNPSINNNRPLHVAKYFNNIDIIKILMNDKRVTNKMNLEEYDKFIKIVNESIKDYLKPKSDDKIDDELFKLPPSEILRKSINNKYMKGIEYLILNEIGRAHV